MWLHVKPLALCRSAAASAGQGKGSGQRMRPPLPALGAGNTCCVHPFAPTPPLPAIRVQQLYPTPHTPLGPHQCPLSLWPPPPSAQQFVSRWLFHFSEPVSLTPQQMRKLQKEVSGCVGGWGALGGVHACSMCVLAFASVGLHAHMCVGLGIGLYRPALLGWVSCCVGCV